MSGSTLFKRAYVRGLNAELVRTAGITYPSKEAADHAADYVADNSGMPDPSTQGDQITLKVAHELCVHLTRASEHLCKTAGHKADLAKTASAVTPGDLASQEAFQLMQKVAYENETPNTLEEAAKDDSAARLDLHNRPAGYAETGVGNGEDKGKGAVGTEEKANRGDQVDGGNSATETSKAAMASAIERLRKIASSPYQGHPNTPAAAAATTDAGKLDEHNRPAGYAAKGVDGVGKTDVKPTGSAILGSESAAHRGDRVSGSNTVTPLAKSAMAIFDKTAALTVPFLPEKMADRQKVAHINAMAPLSTGGKAKYLEQMYLAYGADKTAAATTAGVFLKAAEDDEGGKEDFEVAKAMEQAAEEIEDTAVDKMTTDKCDDDVKEAAFKRLRDAAARIATA